MLEEYTIFTTNCSVNSNFNLWTTGIRCPHAFMCMDNLPMHKKLLGPITKYGTGNLGNFEIGYWELGGMVVQTRRCPNVLRADFFNRVYMRWYKMQKYQFEHLDVGFDFTSEFLVISTHNHLRIWPFRPILQ